MGTKLQRFLWTVAGAELDILEKCRTDHKKFAAIGATILMTAFIAFCAGTSAAWYFTQSGESTSGSIGWSLLFGFIWALLIFCIDRSLVITLKKDPLLKRQKFLVPLISRSLLACIIAFMVSIPLELVIFEDFIAEKKFDFDVENKQKLTKKIEDANGENKLEEKIKDSEKTMDKLDSLNKGIDKNIADLNSQIEIQRNKLNKPTTAKFTNAKSRYNEYSNKINIAKIKLENAATKQDSTRYIKEIRELKDSRQPYWRIMNDESKEWNENIKNKIRELEKKRDNEQKQYDENKQEYKEESKRKKENSAVQDSLGVERRATIGKFDTITKKGNHFIQNYRVLEYAVWERDDDGNLPTELFFLWMIRLLFFIIEILPTVVKIVTPVGSYDRMVHAEESQMSTYLESDEYIEHIRNMHDMELKTREEQLKKQNEIEMELKNDILEKVKNAQMEVANATIQKWKESEISKIKTDSVEIKSEEGE